MTPAQTKEKAKRRQEQRIRDANTWSMVPAQVLPQIFDQIGLASNACLTVRHKGDVVELKLWKPLPLKRPITV